MRLEPGRVAATLRLLDGGDSVPFITRYRQEVTGGLDEDGVRAVRDGVQRLRELEKAVAKALAALAANKALPAGLKATVAVEVRRCPDAASLAELMAPYKGEGRKTLAAEARAAGCGASQQPHNASARHICATHLCAAGFLITRCPPSAAAQAGRAGGQGVGRPGG